MVEITPPAAEGGTSGPGRPAPVPNLFTGMPPLIMLGLGVVIGAAVSFAIGVVIWSVFG
jgi:hypothetical protein